MIVTIEDDDDEDDKTARVKVSRYFVAKLYYFNVARID